jgi:hypothetical protein
MRDLKQHQVNSKQQTDTSVREKTHQQTEYQQRLLKLYIEHIKRTGEVDYPRLIVFLRQTYLLSNLPKQLEALNFELQTLERIKSELIYSTIALKQILDYLVDKLRPANSKQIFYNLSDRFSAGDLDLSMISKIRAELYKIATNVECLLDLTEKYAASEKNRAKNTFKNIRPDLAKLAGDLAYFRHYLEQQIAIEKIQQEIYRVNDPVIYLQRLNQYLDILPQTAIALATALENLIRSEIANTLIN